jgi:L-fuconate dehydratase
VGLCEYVQHESIFDFIAVSGSLEGRIIEFVDHLHEHFVDPCVVQDGRYRVPLVPGTSATMKAGSIAAYAFPQGAVWQRIRAGSSVSDGGGVSGVPPTSSDA